MKGKPWTVEEEKQLRQLAEEKKSVSAIAQVLGKTVDSVDRKMRRLGVESKQVGDGEVKTLAPPPTHLKSRELPSVEEVLGLLNAALKSLETPGLDPAETLRLRCIIQAVKTYKELFADYLGYRKLEVRVEELIRDLEDGSASMAKKTSNG